MKETDTYYYDEATADRAVRWIETLCTHVKGSQAGHPLLLENWQKDEIIRPMFGWKSKETGLRKYKKVFVFIPRKNGKSTLGSAIALYLLSSDGEPGAEIYSAASDTQQASIIHEVAKTMILQQPELSDRMDIYKYSITYKSSFYKVLSKTPHSKHGFNAHGVIIDELHALPDRELYDVLVTSTGSRKQPLTVIFTTAGYDRNTICYEIYAYAKKVRDGIVKDDTFLPVIYEADEKDDPFVEQTWRKANPNFGISLQPRYIVDEATTAQNQPAYENTFRRLQLNQWTTSETKWISDHDWMLCAGELPDLTGLPCWCGLDLASTRDITAFVMVFPNVNGKHYVIPKFFIPSVNAVERSKRDGVMYSQWVKEGVIIETEGDVTDYDAIRAKIAEWGTVYDIRRIAYDRWNASQLVINLASDGFDCLPFGQGYGSMTAPCKELEKLVYSSGIIHDGDPVLRWMCSNVMVMTDSAGNLKINKAKSTEKVDGMVALVMGLGAYMGHDKTSDSIFDERGIRSV